MTLLLTVLLLLQTPSQANEQDIAAPITDVTVFQRGAQVTRATDVRVPSGTTRLTFTGLAPGLDPESIQLNASGAVTVLSVVHRTNYLEDVGPSEAAVALQTVRQTLRDSLKAEEMLLDVYEQEEALLLANTSIGGTTTGVEVAELRAAADFFRTRLTEIKARQREIAKTMERLRERLTEIEGQLSEIAANRPRRTTSEVDVTLTAATPVQSALTLRYLAPNAGWTPRYDLRVDDVEGPIAFAYNANVTQQSGEDWTDVRLTLSTGDPSRPGTIPNLMPWRLSFYRPPPADVTALDEVVVMDSNMQRRDRAVRMQSMNAAVVEEEAESLPVPVQQVTRATTVEFAIDVPYTIPSDGKPYAVQIESYEVPAAYRYYAAPKLDEAAYLTALVTGWEDLNLLSGPANLFFEGTYVGESFLDVTATQDTLVVSLGQDAGVVIDRTKQRDFSDRSFLGRSRSETVAFETEIRNTKRRPIEIVIEDQIPVSTNDQIDIEHELGDGATLDEETGLLRWQLTVPPQTTKDVAFRYTVEYPNDERVVLE